MPHSHNANRGSSGGAGAAGGFEFQAQVFARYAARAIADLPPGLGLDDDVRITGIGGETGLPLDDVGITLSNGGFVLVQAKAGMRQLRPQVADLRQAIDQVVTALLYGLVTSSGVRAVEPDRDRLVIATNHAGSRTFDELSKVCARFPGHPENLSVEGAAKTLAQEHALTGFLAIARKAWSAATGHEPSNAETRLLLGVLQVRRFDFQELEGIHLLRTTETLLRWTSSPLVDEPFETLVSLGRRAIRTQTWFSTEQLRQKLRRDARAVPDAQTPNWLRELPQPYVERGLPELTSDAAEAHAITVISGPAGCGKTTLAVRLAHRLAHRFPDGQLMVDMRGFAAEAPMSTNEAVDLLLHQMGMFGSNGNESPEARRLHLVRTLENGRFIVVLDNVADSLAVRPLLPRGDSSRTIIASRRTLATVAMKHGADSLELGLLTTTEAEELFAALVGRERMDSEPEAAARLLAACGNLPLAVSIAGRQIALLPGQALEQIASALTESESRLDFLDLGEPEASIRSILSWSYMSLGPDQRQTYLLVGAAPGPDFDVPAAISLLGSEQARGALRALRQLGLAQENTDGSFTMHDLLRDFAASLARAGHVSEEALHLAHGRLLGHYVRLSQSAAWVSDNLDRLLTAAQHRVDGRHEAALRTLTDSLIEPLWHRGRFDDAVSLLRSTMTVLPSSGREVVRAYFLRLLAISLRRAGDPSEGAAMADSALQLLEGDTTKEAIRSRADCHYILGTIKATNNDHESALGHFQLALDGFEHAGTEADVGDVLNAIGWSLTMTGEHTMALAQCRRAAAIHERVGPANSLAADLDSIGYIHRLQGDHSEALDHFERCLKIYRDMGYRTHEARTLEELGETAKAAGDLSSASLYWSRSAVLRTEIGAPPERDREIEGDGQMTRSPRPTNPKRPPSFLQESFS